MDSFLELENRHTGEILRMRRLPDASGEIMLLIEGSLPAGMKGPPAHAHFHQREEATVKAGLLGIQVGKEKTVVPVGGSAAFPAGAVHSWWNAGQDLLELSGRSTPAADLDHFLQALFAVLNASEHGRPSIFYLAKVLWRHRRTQAVMTPPPAVQRMVFPLVLLVGHILGKYRGGSWPGAPESCTGAPQVEAMSA